MAARVEIRATTHADIADLAENMRALDRVEYAAIAGNAPAVDVLSRELDRNPGTRSFLVNGRLVAVYGVVRPTALSTQGYCWMLCTNEMNDPVVRREVARHSRQQTDEVFAGHSQVTNFCAKANSQIIRWLKWLGFTFASQTQTHNGVEFVQFWKEV